MKLKSYLWSILAVAAGSVAAVGCSDDSDVVTPPTPPVEPTLSFTLSVENIAAHGADLKVVPSENDQTYYAACLPSEDVQGKDDQAIVGMIMADVKEADLFKGEHAFAASEMNLKAQTSYTFMAFGYAAGKATTAVEKEKFMTIKDEEKPEPEPSDEAPEVTLFGVFNDEKASCDFTMQCVSKNAEKAGYMALPSEFVEQQENKGMTIEQIVEQQGGYAEIDVTELNGEGLTHSFGIKEGLKPGMRITFVLKAENAKGSVLKRAESQLQNTIPNEGPDVVLTSHGNSSSIWFTAKAITRDAVSGAMGVFERTKIDDILNAGGSLSDIIEENESNTRLFTPFDQYALDMLNMVESEEGLRLEITGAQTNIEYTALLFVNNANGRTIKRAEAKVNLDESKVIEMTESMFLDNVWNYQIDSEFKYRGEGSIAIDFYADWCGNCKAMEPIYNKMADEFAGKVTFYRCNVENTGYVHQMIAKHIGVDGGIPLFVFISNTGEVTYLQGRVPEAKMRSMINKIAGEAKNPDVVLTGEFDAQSNLAKFFMQCTSKDAKNAQWMVANTTSIDNFIAENNMTIEDFVDYNGKEMSQEYIAALNGAGIANDAAVEAGASVTCLLDVENLGGRTVKRADVAAPGTKTATRGEAVRFFAPKREVSMARATKGYVMHIACSDIDVNDFIR